MLLLAMWRIGLLAGYDRDAEVSFVEARDKALTAGETWARVAFFCDFQLKGEGRDTSRMRDLLIQLKN
jgi:hypothetical protein